MNKQKNPKSREMFSKWHLKGVYSEGGLFVYSEGRLFVCYADPAHADTQNQWRKALVSGSTGKGSILPFLLAANSTISCVKYTGPDLQHSLAKDHRSFLVTVKIQAEILTWSENAVGTHLPAAGPKELAWVQLSLSGKESNHWGAESIRMKKWLRNPSWPTCEPLLMHLKVS